jgi:hypothetical protein
VCLGIPVVLCCGIAAIGNLAQSQSNPPPPQQPVHREKPTAKRNSSEPVPVIAANDPPERPMPRTEFVPDKVELASTPIAPEPEPMQPSTVEPNKTKHEVRTWHSVSGSFSVDAAFVRMSNGKVYLRKEDGKEIEVEEAKLSPADVNYIERLRPANIRGR